VDEVLQVIHPVVQDTDNFNLAWLNLAVKNKMSLGLMITVSLSYFIALPTQAGIIGSPLKAAVQFAKVDVPLLSTASFCGITANSSQISPGFVGELKGCH
jgi:hypothetical protein